MGETHIFFSILIFIGIFLKIFEHVSMDKDEYILIGQKRIDPL